MRIQLSYSIKPEEAYLVPILAATLIEKGLFPSSKNWTSGDKVSSSKVDSSTQIFVGIISDARCINQVGSDYTIYKEANIPSIILVEDSVSDKIFDHRQAIVFSRNNPQRTATNLWLLKNSGDSANGLLDNIAVFIGGIILEALTNALSPMASTIATKLTSINVVEDRLQQLNEARFQELCDVFLAFRYPEIALFLRKGSKLGTQKTIKGTPDSLFRLENGSYILIEVTSQEKGLVKKVLSDIDKASDEGKTGIAVKDVWKLIICSNRVVSGSDIDKIEQYAKGKGINNVDIYTLEHLAAQIYLHHQDLAKNYLELVVTSGQIVPIEEFVSNYDRSGQGVATSLLYPFRHRVDELEDLVKAIDNERLILISGPAGVGKTKLALEAITIFGQRNPSYKLLALQNKDVDLLEDLYSNFKPGSHSILFIDDVNRFSRINSVIGFFRSTSNVDLKIVLTTRDYGLNQIQISLSEVSVKYVRVSKFKDDEIRDIISSAPFNINEPSALEKIVDIADGNIRLAIMISKLVLDKQDIRALSDVADLFDKYFLSFVKDEKLFANKTLLKTIGIVSFFYTFPYSNKSVLHDSSKSFDISQAEIIDSISQLEELEFVDINFDHAKISDQTLATFYFYKVFLKDKLLSFYNLLANYFVNNSDKFKDSFYPVVNSFGFSKVKDLAIEDLVKFYDKLTIENSELAFKLLNIFHFYLHEQSISFVHGETLKLSDSDDAFDTEYKGRSNNVKKTNAHLNLIANFFQTDVYLKEGLEVSFEYVRKLPALLKELLGHIVQDLTFEREDHYYGYNRQKILFDLFYSKIRHNDELYISAFLAIAHEFLEFGFQHTKGIRGNKISFYTMPFSLTDESRAVRRTIWELLDYLFPANKTKVLSVLEKHSARKPDVIKEVLEFDLQFLIPMIENHLVRDEFIDSMYVQNLLYWLKRQKINSQALEKIKESFQNKYYRWYEKLSWDRLKNKEGYDFNNWGEFERLKEGDIRKFTFFENENQLFEFITFFNGIKELVRDQGHHFNNSIDIIFDEKIKRDPIEGFNSFAVALSILNKRDPAFVKTITSIAQSEALRDRIWTLHEQGKITDFNLLLFFSSIPGGAISEEYLDKFYDLLRVSKESIYLYPTHYKALMDADASFLLKLGEISERKNEKDEGKIQLDHSFFEYSQIDQLDHTILKRIYIQQDRIQNHFDYSGDALLSLIELDSSFISDYVKYVLGNDFEHSRHLDKKSLGKIWNFFNYTELIDEVLEVACNQDVMFRSQEHFVNSFFRNAEAIQSKRVEEYLLNYIERFHFIPRRIDLIFDVIRHSANHIFQQAYQLYLSHNSRIEDFKEIQWLEEQILYAGNVIVGDVKAAKWRYLLELTEGLNLGLNGFEIIRYIKDQISAQKKYGDWERERKFLSRR